MKPRMPADLLKAVEVFRALPDEAVRRLYANAHTVSLTRGEVLAKAGTRADALYIVISGRLIAKPANSGGETAAAHSEFGPGMAADALRFFAREAHPADLVAARASTVLRLGYEELVQTAVQAPQLWPSLIAAFGHALAEQSPQTCQRITRPKTIALCHGGREPIPPFFLDRFADALEARAVCQFLSAEALGQDLPGGLALDDPQVVHWLEEQERVCDLVVYLADPEPTPWAERAIAQADQVLIVGMHDGAAAGGRVPVNPIEQLAHETHGASGCRLALVNDRAPGTPVAGTSRWLAGRQVRSHHHVCHNDAAAYERLVSFVLGRARGVFLSGAALLGAAHLGVVKALMASGIAPDAFGGTGAGAFVGGLLALGWTPDDLEDAVNEIFLAGKALTAPGGAAFALFDHKRFDRLIARHIPACDIADLPIPFYAVSANLSAGAPCVHRNGSLHTAIRANWLPAGALPPFITPDGDMLVDGSTLQSALLQPLQALGLGGGFWVRPEVRRLGASPIAYAEVAGGGVFPRSLLGGGRGLNGKRLLQAVPGLADAILRMQCASWAQDGGTQNFEGIRILAPPMPADLSLFDWSRHAEVVDISYGWGLREIARLRKQEGDVLTWLLSQEGSQVS